MKFMNGEVLHTYTTRTLRHSGLVRKLAESGSSESRATMIRFEGENFPGFREHALEACFEGEPGTVEHRDFWIFGVDRARVVEPGAVIIDEDVIGELAARLKKAVERPGFVAHHGNNDYFWCIHKQRDKLHALADHTGGHADGDGPGREIAADDGPGPHNAAIADGHAAEHGDAGTEPDVRADFGGPQLIADRANDRADGRHTVV